MSTLERDFFSCPSKSLGKIISDPTGQTRCITALPVCSPASPLGAVCTPSFSHGRWGCNTRLPSAKWPWTRDRRVTAQEKALDVGLAWTLMASPVRPPSTAAEEAPGNPFSSSFLKLLTASWKGRYLILNKTHANCCSTPLLCKAKLLFIYVTFSFN